MPSFTTPKPIQAVVKVEAGDVHIAADEERAETVVHVRPSNSARDADVKAAEQTTVVYEDGVLTVRAPKQRGMFGRTGSVEVDIAVPAGSQLDASSGAGEFTGTGRLDTVRLKSGAGHIKLERTGPLSISTGAGHITVASVAGAVDISTGSGTVDLHDVTGDLVVKNSNGDTRIGEVLGGVRVKAANGDISIARAHADVDAKTANGGIRVDEVTRGSVRLETAVGQVSVGIREGSSAWLDLNTTLGGVRNSLTEAASPEKSAETVEVRARTQFGDIVIWRA
ncbi:DUF4097 family beta strand repeat-containing protein [Yinghuangia seranimata]|uniref:DUF4097 family beta strand repeat-containing protein n=1 Tax=Yinghuangia seranimata TaxID=408067 RepID=UPI00248CA5DE|nr:DUF4097 family beta strand repeat-containing protein [Yinghuangia seranimata]MDI2127835.1 DUF4097 family beta strand repeat-containing protein [Yinghuangia seranimata]